MLFSLQSCFFQKDRMTSLLLHSRAYKPLILSNERILGCSRIWHIEHPHSSSFLSLLRFNLKKSTWRESLKIQFDTKQSKGTKELNTLNVIKSNPKCFTLNKSNIDPSVVVVFVPPSQFLEWSHRNRISSHSCRNIQ